MITMLLFEQELTSSLDVLRQPTHTELEQVLHQVRMYKEKCEEADRKLSDKDKIIENLQNSVKQLSDKVSISTVSDS